MSRLDLLLWLATLAMEISIVALLLRGRIYRVLPILSLYVLWTVLSDLGMMIAQWHFGSTVFKGLYLYEVSIDSALQFGVLVELAWSVLRPIRKMLPRWTLAAIALLILTAGAAVWPLAGLTQIPRISQYSHLILRLQHTFSILRILFFVVLAAGSQLFSLSWRDREMQVATGLGFYSLASLAGALVQAQMAGLEQYHFVDQVVAGCYMVSLVYWAFAFVQKEAPRQEFSPQMQSFLLKVSGSARAGRIALQDRTLSDSGPR